IPVPDKVLLLLRQFEIRLMDWEIEFMRIVHQLVPVPAHALPAPREDGVLVDRKSRIWDHQVFIYSNNVPITLALGAGTVRVIETEEVSVWLQECYSVQFELIAELPGSFFCQYLNE